MDHHDALEHEFADPPRSRERSTPDHEQSPGRPLGNAAMSQLLGGGSVDRTATKQQGAGPLDEEIAGNIKSARGGGQAMDDTTRGDMESHLGTDLSGVRVHTGGEADNLSRSVQAEAFTTGTDVFFRSGKYQPSTTDGRRLLAHELTHVVQQSSGDGGGGGRVSHPDDPHEREAAAVGDAVAGSPTPETSAAQPAAESPAVARAAAPEEEEEVARAAAPEEEQEEEVARAAAPEEEQEEDVARAAAPEEEEEVARAAAPEEEEEVARAAAPEEEQEEEVARAAAPEEEQEEEMA